MSDDIIASPRLTELLRMRRFLDAEITAERQRIIQADHGNLVRAAADLYGTEVHSILSDDGSRNVTNARMTACWLLRETGLSFPDIGHRLGVHHTTVMHACRTIAADPSRLALARGLLAQEVAA